MEQASFEELGRIRVSKATELVVSTVAREGGVVGININSYITTPKFTGWTKGTFVPADKLTEFAKLVVIK